MGLGIYASTGVTFMHTFVTTKELKLLYFDGQSAVLSAYGTLDSQTALLRQHILKEPGIEFTYNETARGYELCALANDMHVDGVMRMDAGFETLICNFESSHLVQSHVVNVTVPGIGSSREDDPGLPQDPTRPPPHGIGNMYASNNGWEWVRSGTWHYGGYGHVAGNHPESRVDLNLCGFVTFYDPNLRSLSGRHHELIDDGQSFQSGWGLRRGHRLLDVSVEDSAMVKTWVRTASDIATSPNIQAYSPARWFEDRVPCSGINWQALTETIVSQHKGRITEIAAATARYQQGLMSLEDFFVHTHGLSHATLQPFLQYPTENLGSIEEIKHETLQRCELLYTKHISSKDYNRFEALIKDSVEIVLRRICSWEWDTFVWTEKYTSNLLPNDGGASHEKTTNMSGSNAVKEEVKTFAQTIKDFLKWINWDLWTQCDEKCSWNVRARRLLFFLTSSRVGQLSNFMRVQQELCYIPMWPLVYAPGKHQGGPYGGSSNLTYAEQRDFWRPQCLDRKAFDRGGGRGRDPDHQLPDVLVPADGGFGS